MPDHYVLRRSRASRRSARRSARRSPRPSGFAWAAQDPARTTSRARLLRRGRDELGRVPQRAELRRRLHGAGRPLLPQQRLGHERPAERQTASAASPSRASPTASRACACDGNDVFAVLRVDARRDRARVARRGADADRGAHLPHAGHSTRDDPRRPPTPGRPKKRPDRPRAPLPRARGLWTEAKQRELEAEARRRDRRPRSTRAEKLAPPRARDAVRRRVRDAAVAPRRAARRARVAAQPRAGQAMSPAARATAPSTPSSRRRRDRCRR